MSTDNKLTNKETRKDNSPVELTYDKPVFSPATDIYEEGESIFVLCDLPGVNEKDIDISLENDVLTITAHQAEEENDNKYEWIHKGYLTGIYKRSFTVSDGIDREKIKARLNNGVLKLELPKSEALKPKKIKVSG